MNMDISDLVEMVHDLNLETNTDAGPDCPFRLMTDGFEWAVAFYDRDVATSEEHAQMTLDELRGQVLANTREHLTDLAEIKLPSE